MRLATVPLAEAVGHILCHNLADPSGRKVFAKGRRLRPEDLPGLAALGLRELRVAILAPDDIHEDVAAARLAAAAAGPGVTATAAHAGRVNLRAAALGPLNIDPAALLAVNEVDGLTMATLPAHRLVRPGEQLATIKVIPFAVPAADLARAEAAAAGLLRVRPLARRRVGVVLVSSPAARLRVERGVFPAVAGRLADLGAELLGPLSAQPEEAAVAAAIAGLQAEGAELLIVAGETSVVDADDVTPRAVRLLGGRVAHYGAPVEPGNLLLLAYLGELPLIGAPGCVRSRDVNIVDLILPRLMAGEPLGRREIIALGHGGLLH